MSNIKVYEVSGDTRPLNAISVWDASSSGTRPINSIPVWKDTNNGDRPLNSIQVKIVDKAPNAIPVWFNGGSEPGPGPGPEPSLPPFTLRLKFTEGITPSFYKGTGVQVSSSPNIWDLTYENTDWGYLLSYWYGLLEVIGGNTSDVRKMNYTFSDCRSLTSVSLFDTSNVSSMSYMFSDCRSLTSVPLFDTSNVTIMQYTFCNCFNVQSGALALYQQASTQTNPPPYHERAFVSCGSNTETGSAELAQIPDDWK